MKYRLDIKKIHQTCFFELTWNGGRCLAANLSYPSQLNRYYQAWRSAYLGYYKYGLAASDQGFRGRGVGGQVTSTNVDWHGHLMDAQTNFLSEFRRWLRQPELYDIQKELVQAAQKAFLLGKPNRECVTAKVFLTCFQPEIARLPWENSELVQDSQGIEIVRSPKTIRTKTVARPSYRKGRTRVLVIIGDETRLNFKGDKAALKTHAKILDIHYVGWESEQASATNWNFEINKAALREKICHAIDNPLGWDVLIFIGHSNESELLEGQISIAPNTTISIKTLKPFLTRAQQRGLQFALFNSCSGLHIADSLIGIGLSQVAIMREPIHNLVGEAFLVSFLQGLARHEDVEQALTSVCQFLKQQDHSYPSAYLVPSLFRHPESVPYRLEPSGWKHFAKQLWQTNWQEVLVVTALSFVSLLPPVHYWLMDQRVWVQAAYRDQTRQATMKELSPVLLVQIDTETLRKQKILGKANPINRKLLADIISTLGNEGAQVIGIDYALDSHDAESNPLLKQVLEHTLIQQETWFVFGTFRDDQGYWQTVLPEIASLTWSLEGDTDIPYWHLLPKRKFSTRPSPFSYQIAVSYLLSQSEVSRENWPKPNLSSQTLLNEQLDRYFERTVTDFPLLSDRAYLHPITEFSYSFRQRWLQPIIDFSLPPEKVYAQIPAWQLLQNPDEVLQELGINSFQDQAVLIIPGGYDEAGLHEGDSDSVAPPSAFDYWQRQTHGISRKLPKGEVHGYMVHHLLTNWLVIPIPTIGLILLTAIGGKALKLHMGTLTQNHRKLWGGGLAVCTTGYGLLSLQMYVSYAILLPWLLPTLTIGCFVLPKVWEKRNGS